MDDRIPSRAETVQRVGWGAGLAVGMGAGVALGVALDDMGAGIGIGLAIGVAVMAGFTVWGARARQAEAEAARRDPADAAGEDGPAEGVAADAPTVPDPRAGGTAEPSSPGGPEADGPDEHGPERGAPGRRG